MAQEESACRELELALQTARAEAAKSQAALAKTKEVARREEQLETLRIEREQAAVVAALTFSLDGLREETRRLSSEWESRVSLFRGRSEAVAATLLEAKEEALERKRELDATKARLAVLTEKLHAAQMKGNALRRELGDVPTLG